MNRQKLGVLLLGISIGTALLAALSSISSSAQAVQLSDGTVFFISPPRLEGASTTQNSARAWVVTYYFTVTIPENAGEPLQKVTIAQDENTDTVRFSLRETEAFEGSRGRLGATLPLGGVSSDPKTRAVTVTFNPPVEPGKTVTIALSPRANPDYAGVYLFGVTAFPPGEKPHGQFLGFGRFNIYSSGLDAFFRFR
ncbi:DUF2808 domain-containing protein [Myxacorys almedinensis]|uniref:DUF2808 domain-containing protein n=1 Tax=Myxacorys almedinensis A TaxID=2690445 RepID=A0A8J7Z5H1_9CYAN|nr:DUF2808 domain-containing protein [Myxacorys almedinensis]NDJ18458.1 DUF2808 domain-containing protein [Myxacorys almedinensis A]